MIRFIIGLDGDDFMRNQISVIDKKQNLMFKIDVEQFAGMLHQAAGKSKTYKVDHLEYSEIPTVPKEELESITKN